MNELIFVVVYVCIILLAVLQLLRDKTMNNKEFIKRLLSITILAFGFYIPVHMDRDVDKLIKTKRNMFYPKIS